MDFDIGAFQQLLSGKPSAARFPKTTQKHADEARDWMQVKDYGAAVESWQRAWENLADKSGQDAGWVVAQRVVCMHRAHMKPELQSLCSEALRLTDNSDPSQRSLLHRIRAGEREINGQFNEAFSDYQAAGELEHAERCKLLAVATGQELERRSLTGERVRLCGLKTQELNGQWGYCGEKNDTTGRYAVTLEADAKTIGLNMTTDLKWYDRSEGEQSGDRGRLQ